MKAIGYKVPGPIAADAALVDINLPRPVAAGYDILVEVKAVSVNPVDYKVRNSTPPADGDWKVLGWDAAGIVREVGPDVTQFELGDEVYYAGSITRPGTNAEFHLVDARIVGHKPASLSWAEAAALPLTTLTAWEAMFDRLDVAKPVPGAAEAILIIGGAGGVGSIAVQIARQRTDLTVIATASRPETQEWVRGLGAHHVIDHSRPLAPQIAELIAPQGRFGLIDDPKAFDIMVFKRKAVSIHHELMFTRSIYGTPDMNEQGEILDAMAALVDDGKIRTTLTRRLSPINAANLKTVHALIESGAAKGKIVLEGF
ncbi:zinc-binding alcohol dehydrogenase family protein [Citrobacter freundii complex sp. CFNIH9]|uniref:zinc-binding alcohol dehydrogenase family protein n=1 Tax=Citrobacter freundii complex sp. CFNIH9 TaxID=2077149 RepID=UPI000CD00A51|nr:zinc-binding alcohol dehydrogenase family protein [Citrobacter freundii complex sp. CFNIH9]AUV46199.1 zinc-binding alcohol dehydrogenase family protein [Citrobacter freundii complex sp. CFNIH9]